MNVALLFQDFCNTISNEPSKKKKELLAEEYVLQINLHSDMRSSLFTKLLGMAFHPLEQFFIELPESDAPESLDFDFQKFEDYARKLRNKELSNEEAFKEADSLHLGKWLRRVLNKNLSVGLGGKSISRIFSYPIAEEPWEAPEKLGLESPLDWESLYYELQGTCYVLAMPAGIQVMVSKVGEKVFSYSFFGFPLKNMEKIEQQILERFKDESSIQIFGKLYCGGSNREVEVFSKSIHKEEAHRGKLFVAAWINEDEKVFFGSAMENTENVEFSICRTAEFKGEPPTNWTLSVDPEELWIYEAAIDKFYRTKLTSPALPIA